MHILFVGSAKSTVCDEQNTTNKAPSALIASSELDEVQVKTTAVHSAHAPGIFLGLRPERFGALRVSCERR